MGWFSRLFGRKAELQVGGVRIDTYEVDEEGRPVRLVESKPANLRPYQQAQLDAAKASAANGPIPVGSGKAPQRAQGTPSLAGPEPSPFSYPVIIDGGHHHSSHDSTDSGPSCCDSGGSDGGSGGDGGGGGGD